MCSNHIGATLIMSHLALTLGGFFVGGLHGEAYNSSMSPGNRSRYLISRLIRQVQSYYRHAASYAVFVCLRAIILWISWEHAPV